MKDLKIAGKTVKRELIILVFCFIGSFGINIFSILKFETDWFELASQFPIVVFISLIIYILVLIFRLIFIGLKSLTKIK